MLRVWMQQFEHLAAQRCLRGQTADAWVYGAERSGARGAGATALVVGGTGGGACELQGKF